MRLLSTLVASVALFFTACGGGGGGAPGQSPSGSGLCIPIAPMQLLVLEHGSEWEPVAVLAADGSISQSVTKSPGVAFRIVADELQDPKGAPKMSCDASRVLHMSGSQLTMHFDASDALVGSGGDQSRIFVSDAGAVEVTMGGASRPMPWRVAGMSPATRRTAELLVLATMASVDWRM